MAKAILKNVNLLAGAIDLTGYSNKITMEASREEKETTTFGSYDATTDTVWTECIGGNSSAKISGGGPAQNGDGLIDDVAFNALGGFGAWSAMPVGTAAGSLAYLANTLQGSVKLFGQQGDVSPWEANWATSGPLVRGVSLHPKSTARTSTGTGTSVQDIAVPANGILYAALHVLSIAGTGTPTLTVKVQSDSATGFPSSADRITFAAATTVGGQWSSAAGVNTDDWYRVSWTISGTNPSFLFCVTVGVFV